ncbi:L-ribulose-5-phosphate 4-epimerase [Acidipropionibacterium jensenii]|uniref:L-ribulose-5-phosphate 4-epimerase n=1 Tax=Acidipropionibacterium jensenii TaxID=1749 RepID=A0A3Q9UK52_9ACTN|nr:L-ribulose-5-phosphate 4-epimerase [Acidipropionibacterium jensenii]AZZ39888.1 L-ribulose-5-phosphate 4-epimerase [Acidipropionibacterium jensenii]
MTSPATPKQIRIADLSARTQAQIHAAREKVARLHGELIRWNLVVWTAGNVSQRIRCAEEAGTDLLVIKPSGVPYELLTPDAMVVCDLAGHKVDDGTDASLRPSSDVFAHGYVYQQMVEVGGVVHTHSTFATAWAARHQPIPCVLTMMADEFGGEIPVGPLAVIGDDSIGRGIVETLRGSRSRAVLMVNHGPFTIGVDATAAVKTAAMCEEVAHTVQVSAQMGEPVPIPQHTIDRLYARYQNDYGQHEPSPAGNA